MVQANLRFLKRLDLYKWEKPFQLFLNLPADAEDKRQTNLTFEDLPVQIRDIRERDSPPSLDDHGFAVRTFQSSVAYEDMTRPGVVESAYSAEMETLLRIEDESITRVFFFDWRLRSTDSDANHERLNLNDVTKFIGPAIAVHVDQSPAGALHRILLQLPDDATELLQGRVRIINLWKPLLYPVEDYPLAVCDGSTIAEDDLAATDNVRQNYQGESLQVHFNEGQNWYYLSEHRPDEVLLLKMFDSSPTVRSKCCPHGAFKMPDLADTVRPRRSVEVRALVFSPY
ncbi:hypothetical protein QBC34DRAFT_337255 [Podospora aff. communis PSN243]|uniref:Methyltransferase n=1 Tax=Podospora aff. communis PSN243 TaxID=3040156 RepID=A0AAV9G408_9PEZI|nr:hypothetical protein QBC34DRAFT_337255 [Podospora aff. communis PSN243]